MKEVIEILNNKEAIGYLGTVDQGKPRVRPWGFMFEEKGKLYFCTSSEKDVYAQLRTVPYIEYSKTTKEMVWVRVSGEIKFEESVEKKETVLENNEMIKRLYKSADNPIFKLFYLEHGTASISSFSGQPSRKFQF